MIARAQATIVMDRMLKGMMNVKRAKCLMVLLLLVSTTAFAEKEISVMLTADFYGKYIWRGQNIVDSSIFQPSISAGYKGLTGSIWGNMDLTNVSGNSGDFSEADYSLDYSGPIPGVTGVGYSVGAIYYDFPGTATPQTTEVYGGLSLGVPLTPYVRWYRDVDEIQGSYVQFGIGHIIERFTEFSETCYCGFQFGAGIGYGDASYNKGYFCVNSGQFNDCTLSTGLPVCFGSWRVKPSANYSMMISNAIRDSTGKSDNLWFGVSVSRSF
jgi:hypothetical protein